MKHRKRMRTRKFMSLTAVMLVFALLTGCSLTPGREESTTSSSTDSQTEIPKGIFNKNTEGSSNGDTESPTTEEAAKTTEDTPSSAAGMTDEEAYSIYSGVLNNLCTAMLAGLDSIDEMELTDGAGWLYDVMPGRDSETAMASVGYLIKDISGDGVPELLIGSITDQDDGNDYGSYIFSIYTIVNGVPQCSVEGWYRSSYQMMNNGQIFYAGSGGAMYGIFAVYDITKDGTDLICQDYYFTTNTDDTFENYAMYHNTVGESDVSVSEQLAIPEDEFWKVGDDYRSQTYNLPYTTLLVYAKDNGLISDGQNNGTDPGAGQNTAVELTPVAIHIYWASDYTGRVDDYDYYNLADYDNEHLILITTDRKVTDFKVLSLEYQDVTQDGTLLFHETELYHQDQLTPERPFVVGMDLIGTIPNNGISYVDSNGDYRRFAVTESGEDGSLMLMEY